MHLHLNTYALHNIYIYIHIYIHVYICFNLFLCIRIDMNMIIRSILMLHIHTVLLKDNVANARNFFAIYEYISSLSSAFQVCRLV